MGLKYTYDSGSNEYATNVVIDPTLTTFYNNNQRFTVSGTGSLTLSGSIYHDVSVSVITGPATITTSGSSFTSVPSGYNEAHTATTTITNPITVTGTATGSLVYITTFR